jgi:hypothetical protein
MSSQTSRELRQVARATGRLSATGAKPALRSPDAEADQAHERQGTATRPGRS